MIINIQDDILKIQSLGLLDKLLTDKTTGRHIIWATDAYTDLGPRYGRSEQISPELITGPNSGIIKTRARKEMEQQSSRTRQHGEVSTPFWVCKKMCDYADEMWDENAEWQKYVDTRMLEVTCGEAPFLVSRYDVETGEAIPIADRIGLLDRKLRTVDENAQTEEEWLKWAFRAFHATYGYEFQGDNLLIARVNLLMTFEEYLWERWRRKPTISEYGKLITVIVWNVWQMDGLQGTIPYCTAEEEFRQFNLFDFLDGMSEPDKENKQPRCRVYNWLGGGSVEYLALPIRGKRAMKFDFVIGNPPYQEEIVNNGRQAPVYNFFMDETYRLSDCVELITPGRFLFNAGQTPKAWNSKMLSDAHLKVIKYFSNASSIFPNTEIKGGVVITIHNKKKNYGEIGVFTEFEELNSILHKVTSKLDKSINDIAVGAVPYRFTTKLREDHPEYIETIGQSFDLRTNILDKFDGILFFENCPNNEEYVQIFGLRKKHRTFMWVKKEYISCPNNFGGYKLFLPKANGAGKFGETLTAMEYGMPKVGHTQSFISIGNFKDTSEIVHLERYLKGKFSRCLLSVLKTTQDITPYKWKYVPLQDFTSASDIDWSKSIPEIDQQLYKKYGLDEKEIEFIETHVKEME